MVQALLGIHEQRKFSFASLNEAIKAQAYDVFLEIDEENYLNFIRRPALNGFLSGSLLAQAEIQAKQYSN